MAHGGFLYMHGGFFVLYTTSALSWRGAQPNAAELSSSLVRSVCRVPLAEPLYCQVFPRPSLVY